MASPYKVGFTGTQRGLSAMQSGLLVPFLTSHLSIDWHVEFHHGQCVGADEQAARIAKALGYWIVSHPPINRYKMSSVHADEMRPAKEFLVRNHQIVDEVDVLVAAPQTDEEQLRSGTWATIRYARKEGKMIYMLPRGESAPVVASPLPLPTGPDDNVSEIRMPH